MLTAEWEEWENKKTHDRVIECSNCGTFFFSDEFIKLLNYAGMEFCPKCGAFMQNTQEDIERMCGE